MKNLTKFAFIGLTLIVLIFSGCSDSFQEGTIAISLVEAAANSVMASGARAVYPPTPEMRVEMDYTITMQGPTGTLSPVVPKGATSVSVTVAAGTWTVTVNASYQGAPYASGTGSVNVRAGQSNPCIINMSPASAPPDTTPGYGIAILDDDYEPLSILDFGSAPIGYSPITARDVIIKNIGTAPTGTLNIINEDSAFLPSVFTVTDMDIGDEVTFSIRPNNNLSIDVYTTTYKVQTNDGTILASFNVSFEVTNRINVEDYLSSSDLGTAIYYAILLVDEVIVEGTNPNGDSLVSLIIPTGKTVTWMADYSGINGCYILVSNGGNLIVIGSTPSISVQPSSNLVIDGGTVTSTMASAIDIHGKAVIRSGEIIGKGNLGEYPISIYNNGKLAILGGTILNPGEHLIGGHDVYVNCDEGVVYLANAAGISASGISGLNPQCFGYYESGLADRFDGAYTAGFSLNPDAPSSWNTGTQEWN